MSENVESRLSHLEEQVKRILLELDTKTKSSVKDWRQSLGMFDNRPTMKQVDEAATRFANETAKKASMIILDTDHVVTLKYSKSETFRRLAKRMADSEDQDFVTTAVTLEEQMRGWLAQINRQKTVEKQVLPYAELVQLVEFFGYWTLLPFDENSAAHFQYFRKQRIRSGSMDLKIASIAVANDCLLLTANTRDFEAVPGLQIDDWIN